MTAEFTAEEANVDTLYKCTPREVRTFVIDCIGAGLVPFIKSSPGMGKSSIIHSIAEEFLLHLIDERLSTRSPVDLSGLPDFRGEGVQRQASWIPFDTYPVASTPVPKGKDGWALFFDEFNSGQKAVQAAAYKIVLDRMVGLEKLHEKVAIICAGNLETDRAITNPLSTAMQSRLVHIEMELHFGQWLEDVAIKSHYDSRVIAYLNYMPGRLMDFKPNHNNATFCCPRTWEFVNRLALNNPGKDLASKVKLIAGTITPGVAVDFINFIEVFQNIPTYRQILADPDKMMIPSDPPTRWAVISHLMEKVQSDDLDKVYDYVNRFPSDFRILFTRSLLIRHSAWRSRPEVIRGMSDLSRYLHAE
jgi:hypothetical protein